MNYEIVSIKEHHINGFWSAVDSVAREHKYLAFLEGPPMETTRDFVLDHINNDWPQLVALNPPLHLLCIDKLKARTNPLVLCYCR
ncbi:hypothetical protein [Legionella quateirensis]|uniref:Uncharacterized protein n=1 Tax=Legionella quateirensis TaxID=45072 RepID=A0A378KSP0_9GAMM|nr:hypothetical protein [Legionella quateirensis]KTD52979.1 hypothetical protein Lqua_0812 [Legionella quateirensis]STY17199.1 Uncharacterised protein [Legionella quateirensis]